MLKVARIRETYHIFDTVNGTFFSVNGTTWEIIKALKKFEKDEAIKFISKLFTISEKRAKKDVSHVLKELSSFEIDVDEMPLKIQTEEFAPRSVEFDITSRCNSKCIYCLVSEYMQDPTELSTEKIIEVIDELNEIGTWSITLSGGEPTLRSDLFEILGHIDKYELATSVFSNAMNIDENVAKQLSKYKHLFMQVSLDSHSSEHHDKQRGVDGAFEKTIHGIKNLLKYNIFVDISVVVTPININDMEKLAAFLYDLGVKSVRMAPAIIMGRAYENRGQLYLDKNQLRGLGNRISDLNKKYQGKMIVSKSPQMASFAGVTNSKEPLKKCGIGKNNLYIAPNGSVYPCMTLAFPEFVLGNIKKESVKDIWKNSPKLEELRELTVEKIEKCNTCKFKHLCNGGCRGSAYLAHKSLYAPDPVFCAYFGC